MQHTYGYARVSAADQNLDTQLEDLTRAGCTRISQEKVSGTRTRSHALDELLAAGREDNLGVMNRLARLELTSQRKFVEVKTSLASMYS